MIHRTHNVHLNLAIAYQVLILPFLRGNERVLPRGRPALVRKSTLAAHVFAALDAKYGRIVAVSAHLARGVD